MPEECEDGECDRVVIVVRDRVDARGGVGGDFKLGLISGHCYPVPNSRKHTRCIFNRRGQFISQIQNLIVKICLAMGTGLEIVGKVFVLE